MMKIAGSFTGDPENTIDWSAVFRNDSLYNSPLKNLSEVYDNINLNKWLFEVINRLMSIPAAPCSVDDFGACVR